MNKEKPFYTPLELAEILGVSRTTVYRMIERRLIAFYKVGGVLRFKKEDVEAFIEGGRFEPILKHYGSI